MPVIRNDRRVARSNVLINAHCEILRVIIESSGGEGCHGVIHFEKGMVRVFDYISTFCLDAFLRLTLESTC